MKQLSLIALITVFSMSSFAKDIFCASKDESILLSVSVEDQAINGIQHAKSIQLQMSSDKGQLRKSEDVAGGVDAANSKAYFIARVGDSAIRLNINSYQDSSETALSGVLRANSFENGTSQEHQMACVTELNIGF